MPYNASNRPVSLVNRVHLLVADAIKPGQNAIDATVGNGHDTAFLLNAVGANGRVFGFDIQQSALDNCRERTASYPDTCLTLYKTDHAAMLDCIPSRYHGHIAVVMFNLGYLPGSDKRIVTRPKSTLEALTAATRLIANGGLITILAYPGHEGGREEVCAVDNWRISLDSTHYRTAQHEHRPDNPAAPKLFTVRKIG